MRHLEVIPRLSRRRSCLTLACAAALTGMAPALRASAVIDHYISTGDNFFVGSFLPVDSPAAIDASFDLIKNVYGNRRIYWRGLQESLYIDTPLRDDNPVVNRNIENSRDLIQNQNINQYATQAAHARGMEIWGVSSIYDWGVAEKDAIFFGYPGDHEHPIRVNNPEWIPVDKYGYRRQGGPIEYAYAGARQQAVTWHVNEVLNAGYDGMITHSYNENYSMRYQDEFGFSDPIVNEFKSRYGVDIRKETFNRQDWYDLRGEYTTQFVSELHTALAAHGKKLSMPVNATTGAIDKPHYWLGMGFANAGNITQDWEAWAQNHYVDELAIWGSSDIAFNTVSGAVQGTGTPVSLLTSEVYFPPLAPILNSGAPVVGAYSYDEDYLLRSNIPVQPLSSLSSPDIYKQMRVLAQIINGDTAATAADVNPFVSHPNLITRRLALKALGKIGDPASVTVFEQALSDPENAIRTAAIYALIDKNRPESGQIILDAIAQHGNQPLMEGAIAVLRTMSTSPPVLLQAIQNSPHADVRSVAMRSLAQSSSAITASMLPTLTAALNDSEKYVRAYAIDAISRVGSSPTAVTTLVNNMTSSDPILSNRSAQGLTAMLKAFDSEASSRRTEIINGMESLYRKFGSASNRGDKNWGYVPVGNSLYDLVPDGRTRLRNMMNQRTDRKLAENSWDILHLHQKPGEFVLVTETADAYAHFKRPRFDTVVGTSDSFDMKVEGSQIHNQKAEIGQTWQVTQGNLADQTVQSTINNGGKAIKTIRRLGGSHELRLAGDAWDSVSAEISLVTAKADWFRTSTTDQTAFGIDIGSGIEAQILVDPNSFYRVWQTNGTANGGSYIQTNVPAGTGGWETIEIALTWNTASGTNLTGSYDVYLSRDANSSLGAMARTLIADNVPVHTVAERTLQQLFISNQPNGVSDVTTYWDNISLRVGAVLPSLAGDANLDGKVNTLDFNILAGKFGSTAVTWLHADFNYDGVVDSLDFSAQMSNYGKSIALPSSALVPEPSAVALALLTFGRLTRRRRRDQRSGHRV